MGARLSSQLSDEEISAVHEDTGCELFYLSLRRCCRLGCHPSSSAVGKARLCVSDVSNGTSVSKSACLGSIAVYNESSLRPVVTRGVSHPPLMLICSA